MRSRSPFVAPTIWQDPESNGAAGLTSIVLWTQTSCRDGPPRPCAAIVSRTASHEATRVQEAPVLAKIARRLVSVRVTERGCRLTRWFLAFQRLSVVVQ